ncbi:ATP-binding protein [Pseudohaliea sp.]|uniref:ATP-binding protein n=1 Tax=Pseudohaliea sp. TaxID=2740289 RepID=UPI0032EFBC73
MNLRRQLLAVSLLLLALPWAGCQFVREMEGALRSGQAQAVAASARAIAASLHDQPQRFAPAPLTERPAAAANSLYAAPGPPVIIDGYADDWADTPRQVLDGEDGFRVRYAPREHGARLYLLLEVTDPTPIYSDPLRAKENGDRVRLRFGTDGWREALIATAAPGRVRGRPRNSSLSLLDARRIRGSWQDGEAGYSLELDLPLTLLDGRLAFEVVDAAGDADRAALGNLDSRPAPVVVRRAAALDTHLARFADPGTRLQALDSQGYLAGVAAGGPAQGNGDEETFWALRALYRGILRDRPLPAAPVARAGRLPGAEVEQALAGNAATAWYRGEDGSARVAAAAPVLAGATVIGAVRVSQDSEQYLALADAATGRVLALSLAVMLFAVIVLLGYASLLGWRIRRLGRATEAVVSDDGAVAAAFPRSQARDEIGDLSRRFADLLEAVAGYNDYLRHLARQLGHELRTPIAVIQSSLDNLEDASLSPADRATYLQRARDGLGRLGRILAAMSEASRLEDSIRAAELTAVSLAPLLAEVVVAYDDSYPDHCVRFSPAAGTDAATVHGSAELLVQALDKLVDNAASFAPAGSAITVSLRPATGGWQLAVENPGPALPDTLRGQLFEPMVSLRAGRDDSPHLGLGLHVVQLIAKRLGGRATAENRPGNDGAVFSLWLPRPAAVSAGTPAA